MVLVTTPNAEHNVRYEFLADGELRHRDHRFEWTRAEFARWARRVAAERGYQARISGVGPEDPEVGSPTQLAVFSRVSQDGVPPSRGGHDASLDYARAVVA